VQEKAMEEIDGVAGPDEGYRFTMKDLHEMKYLECCIKEALRLYPSVPVIARKISEDINIGKLQTHCLLTEIGNTDGLAQAWTRSFNTPFLKPI
jgi:cytochrome P450